MGKLTKILDTTEGGRLHGHWMLSFDPLFVPGVTCDTCHVSRTIRDHVTPALSLDSMPVILILMITIRKLRVA